MSKWGAVVRVRAPAKLTLSLRVLGVRPDGFHELDAEMVSIDLADDLWIDRSGEGLTIDAEGVAAPPPDRTNLVRRALAAVGMSAGIRLHKRVPVGGGLGGGSSDAAAVLRWARCADLSIAASLGADVPFCVRGGRARVRGLGDRVETLPEEPRAFVLLVPPLAVDTAAAYRAFDALAERRRGAGGANDLTEAALEVVPALRGWRDRLGEMSGVEPLLAGSGATWFVEGTPATLGLDVERPVTVGGAAGRLIPVRTVAAAYGRPEPV